VKTNGAKYAYVVIIALLVCRTDIFKIKTLVGSLFKAIMLPIVMMNVNLMIDFVWVDG